MQSVFRIVGIVGTGAMGRGIAQMSAQAGSEVLLFDAQAGAADAALNALRDTWHKLLTKGKLGQAEHDACVSRVRLADTWDALAPCDLVVEAIVKKLDIKQRLFADLENLVGPKTVLASNTSSLSITAMGAPFAMSCPSWNSTCCNAPSTRERMVTVLNGVTVPMPVRSTGTSRRLAAAVTTGTGAEADGGAG